MATRHDRQDNPPQPPPARGVEHQRANERGGDIAQRNQRSTHDMREEASDDERRDLLVNRPHDFIERTRPEDRLPLETARGQITRDNINPNIPSAPPATGPIVDPNTLGMEQGGVEGDPVPAENVLDTPHGTGSVASINEPQGSTVGSLNPGGPGGPPAEGGGEAEPPDLLDIDPDAATIGDPDVTLTCTGEGFTPESVIVFNGGDEPTTFVNETTLTTIVKPSTAGVAGTFPVLVRSAAGESEPLDFEFVEPAQREAVKTRAKKPKKTPRKKR